MYAAFMIRMENPKGRYWVIIVGKVPADEDAEFVNHRSNFLDDLIQFNELREARKLRKTMIDNFMKGDHADGTTMKYDLEPELKALSDCVRVLHKKLKID